jgi:hypothetical protein
VLKIFFSFLFILGNFYISFGDISDYAVVKIPFIYKGNKFLAIREFKENEVEKVFAVNVNTLKTEIFLKEEISYKNFDISKTRYARLLEKSVSSKIHNGGIKNGKTGYIYLTVDLCPSSKEEPFDIRIIKKFINRGHKNIAFAVSGRWFLKNKKYINWIKKQEDNNKLNVIWINHTFNHFYDPSLSLDKNFLLREGTDISFEILEVEKLFIKEGLIPSVFIRFPGLVANKKLRETVAFKYGLIALGSDAWLAKGEKPKKGSIILIHGNKNEPLGIKIFEKYLNKALNFGSLYEINP